MELTVVVVIYCFGVAAFFLGIWKYYDRRDFRLFENERRKTTFICVRCDHLYTSQGNHDVAKCPRCGHENSRLRF